MGADRSLRPVGVVISRANFPPSHLAFEFQVSREAELKVGDYVEVPSDRGGIVGKVYEIVAHSSYFSDPEVVRDHEVFGMAMPSWAQLSSEEVLVARVRVVGVYDGEGLEPPSVPPSPGEKVFLINKDILRRVLGLSADGAFLGLSWGSEEVEVRLDVDTLVRHHIAVLGVTGSGKSYTCAVMVEELLERGVPVVVIDPHGEYLTLSAPNDSPSELAELRRLGLEPRGYPVRPLSPPCALARGGALTLRLSEVAPEGLAEMCNMTDVQEDLLFLAMRRMRGDRLRDLEVAIEAVADRYGFRDVTLAAIRRRLTVLGELGLLGPGFRPEDVVEPGVATIIDLSADMPERARRVLVGHVLAKLFEARKRGDVPPLLVVVEEAHRFAPQAESTYSKTVMRRIAREGRKFGIGLCVASQRVVGLDKDVLSQCGTKVLMRIDSVTDLNFIAPMLEHSCHDEVKRLPYLPVGTALVTGIALRYPLLVRVRPRKSKHGGAGVSVLPAS